ncbi:MAG: Asp23/Gls24 family envelope stress response protein [Thermoanaerobacterales bacterium]|jgi:uncharacterized alkaline shock family protein YloU|nr:Asp23/Gls24 family envelope stress response protein [Thermoanaerobacterales bacterium]
MEGKTLINETVFADIAMEAMRKVEEVFRKDKKGALSGITKLFADRFAPQINAKKTEMADMEEDLTGSVAFEVKLTVVYGVKIPEVAQKVREKIISEVEDLTGYKVDKVDIVIDRIVMPEQAQEENN